jgi:hypothetical protein
MRHFPYLQFLKSSHRCAVASFIHVPALALVIRTTLTKPMKRFGRLLAIAAVAVLASSLSGCPPGQPAPNGYSCGTLSSGHCYSEAMSTFGASSTPLQQCANDGASHIFGYRTSISITSGMNPGDGFIDDEMWLTAENGPGWIEAGYTDEYFFGQHYFWAENDETTGIFVNHDLQSVPAEDDGSYAVVEIFATGPDLTKPSSFTVNIRSIATNFSQTDIVNAMWTPGPDRFAEVNFGQELAGTNGALANDVFFVNNSWMDNAGHWRLQSAPGVSTVDMPPYGGWVQDGCSSAQSSGPNGGTFLTRCCTP